MKAIFRSKIVMFAMPVVAGIILSISPVHARDNDQQNIVEELRILLNENPNIEEMLRVSIAKAKIQNPSKATNPVQSLDQYYDFIRKASKLIPRDVLENPQSLTRDNIYQSICYFYFLVDQPLDDLDFKELKSPKLFKKRIQYVPPFSDWLRDFADTWGEFLDTEESWNQKSYQEFHDDWRYGLYGDWFEPPCNWNTFNRFFSRYLSSRAMRPIALPDDPAVVVAPADSVPQGAWEIDFKSRIKVIDGLKVKHITYYNVNDLLSEKSQFKDVFAKGVLTHTFLNVFDYHRYHFAVGGKILEKKIIQQNVALEVEWDETKKEYDAIDSTGWQFTQTRGYVIVDTGKYGLVALIPMGMAHVSSVNFEGDVEYGITHEKGDMLGTFLFGGSDFIMLFQDKAGFQLTARRDTSDQTGGTYQHVLMGEEYGVMKGQAKH